MAVHCLEMATATNYDAQQARNDLQTYRENHNEVLEVQAADYKLLNTEFDGSGIDYYYARFRFAWSEDLSQLRQDAETWLSNNFDWWGWRYHECYHDRDPSDPRECEWTAQNTSGNVPQAVIDDRT